MARPEATSVPYDHAKPADWEERCTGGDAKSAADPTRSVPNMRRPKQRAPGESRRARTFPNDVAKLLGVEHPLRPDVRTIDEELAEVDTGGRFFAIREVAAPIAQVH